MGKRIKRNLAPRGENGQAVDHILDDTSAAAPPVTITSKAKAGKKAAKPTQVAVTAEVATHAPRLHSYETEGKKPKNKAAKQTLEDWQGANRQRMVCSLVQGAANEAKKEFGHSSVFVGSELRSMLVGLPMPSLALEYLIDNDVFPLSLVVTLAGKKKTYKSTLLYEIFRWFFLCGGGAVHHDCESKFDEELCLQITGADCFADLPFELDRCSSLEEWQQHLTFNLRTQKTRMRGTTEHPGPGRTIPLAFGVDSVMGKSSYERQEKIQKAGNAEREGPVEALKNADYFRSITHLFENWPFTLVLVNHLKTKVKMGGGGPHGEEQGSPGGDIFGYLSSLLIHTSLWARSLSCESFEGAGVKLFCADSSFGVSFRSIKTRILWRDLPVVQDGKLLGYRTERWWDWNWATIAMLDELDTMRKKRLRDLGFHLKTKSPTATVECMAQSRTLGMGDDDWLTFSELGKLIQADVKLKELIRTAIGIKRRALFAGDYLQQLDGLTTKLP